jgi:hypothetical protein
MLLHTDLSTMEIKMNHWHKRSRQVCGALLFKLLLLSICSPGSVRAETFVKIGGIEDSRIRAVAISKIDPAYIAVASDNRLYLSRDAGSRFITAASVTDEWINHIELDPETGRTVYLAGSRNGYRVNETIEKIFTADESQELLFMGRHRDKLFAGTSTGLYFTEQKLINWQSLPGIRNESVFSMEARGGDIYFVCDSGVYLYQTDGTLKRQFAARGTGETSGLTPYQLKTDALAEDRLWLCTSKGVYVSENRGDVWKRFYIDGTGNAATYCLAQFPLDGKHFYLCSDAGFFKVTIASGQARPLFQGLPTSNIRWADVSAEGDVYLATDQGLFRQQQAEFVDLPQQTGLADLLKGEPSIHEVQEAAMRYNSVHPDKTGNWRKRLKYRALLPDVDVDYDKTIGSSFTSSGYYYAQGPYDWGISLSWDMSDLIWNSFEDDIDNRTKLTTQLRLDILDEINRLYFERLRLKHELMQADPIAEATILKQLRLYELTATLDGYTGGLYSERNTTVPRTM